jgi:hypothetical protein
MIRSSTTLQDEAPSQMRRPGRTSECAYPSVQEQEQELLCHEHTWWADPVVYSAPTVHGKVGKGTSHDPARHDAQPGLPAIGKRTLVEQIAQNPPACTSAPVLESAVVQRKASGGAAPGGESPEHIPARVQRKPDDPAATSGGGPAVTPPKGGINKAGFIDNNDGANIRTGSAESGGQKVREQPLPPAMRVFVSGTHPDAPQWWYVTAYLDGEMVRGYVQDFRVTTSFPNRRPSSTRSPAEIPPSNSRRRSTAAPLVTATTSGTTRTCCCT